MLGQGSSPGGSTCVSGWKQVKDGKTVPLAKGTTTVKASGFVRSGHIREVEWSRSTPRLQHLCWRRGQAFILEGLHRSCEGLWTLT